MIWIARTCEGNQRVAHEVCKRLSILHILCAGPDHAGRDGKIIEEERNVHRVRCAEPSPGDGRTPVHLIDPGARLGRAFGAAFGFNDLAGPAAHLGL